MPECRNHASRSPLWNSLHARLRIRLGAALTGRRSADDPVLRFLASPNWKGAARSDKIARRKFQKAVAE